MSKSPVCSGDGSTGCICYIKYNECDTGAYDASLVISGRGEFSIGDKVFFIGCGVVEQMEVNAFEIHVNSEESEVTMWLNRYDFTTEVITLEEILLFLFKTQGEAELALSVS